MFTRPTETLPRLRFRADAEFVQTKVRTTATISTIARELLIVFILAPPNLFLNLRSAAMCRDMIFNGND
jgi:hypothetical protein